MKKRKDWRPERKIFSQTNLNRIRLKNIYWLQNLHFSFPSKYIIRIRFQMNARDRDTGKAIKLRAQRDYFSNRITSSREILAAVRSVAKIAVTHEIDESIYFDNKRIFDPHKRIF